MSPGTRSAEEGGWHGHERRDMDVGVGSAPKRDARGVL